MKNVIKAVVVATAVAALSANAGTIQDQLTIAYNNTISSVTSRTPVTQPSTIQTTYLGDSATAPIFTTRSHTVTTVTGIDWTTYTYTHGTRTVYEVVPNATNIAALTGYVRTQFYGTSANGASDVARPALNNITYTGSETQTRCDGTGGTGCYDATGKGYLGIYYAQIEADIHNVNWIASRTTYATLTTDRQTISGILQGFSLRAARITSMNNAVTAALADIAAPTLESAYD